MFLNPNYDVFQITRTPNNSSKSQVKANLILQVILYDIQKRYLKSKVPVDNVVFLITFASYLLTPSMETLK